jgi:GNAT superfamily N-acetyltransferase
VYHASAARKAPASTFVGSAPLERGRRPQDKAAMSDDYELSNDRERLDVDLIHRFLAQDSYWARGIPRAVVERSLCHSLCFGLYQDGKQVAFARVITDFATFGYIGDVFVVPEHRGRGLGKRLIRDILAHPELAGFRRWLLATDDAHGLYAQFGFTPLARPDQMMEIRDRNLYRAQAPTGREG